MSVLIAVLMLTPLLQADTAAPAGRADAGKTTWTNTAPYCSNCHGMNGEGGFGPDLAGRGLNWSQFKRAVRQPWGIMPAYTETQLTEQRLADIYAFLSGLPKVQEPARPRLAVTQTTPAGQVAAIQAVGCAQCHQAELGIPRRYIGGEGGDYNVLANLVYEHTQTFATGRMGNYSRQRLPESTLQEIWKFMSSDLGLRVPIDASIDAGVAAGANKTYTLTVVNSGKAGKGLTAEDVTIALALPSGVNVVSTTGAGYKGVRAAAAGSMATWQAPKIAPGEKQTFTLTLSGSAENLFKGSAVSWAKPEVRRPSTIVRQAGLPESGDAVDVTIARPTASQ
jgi:mono/diheme cytochrome c family protein